MNGELQTDCVLCQKLDRGDEDLATDPFRPAARFEPLNPVTPGHMLFIPTWHAEHRDVTGLTTAMRAAYNYATAAGHDFNLITSSGSAATQTIPHLHVHYVPRHEGDGLHLPWTGQQR